jgi:hypothetical protein
MELYDQATPAEIVAVIVRGLLRTEPWDWPPPRRRRPPPIYIDHERPRPRSFWQTRAAQVLANAVFWLGVFVWKAILVGVLMGLMIFAALVLVALVKAVW